MMKYKFIVISILIGLGCATLSLAQDEITDEDMDETTEKSLNEEALNAPPEDAPTPDED